VRAIRRATGEHPTTAAVPGLAAPEVSLEGIAVLVVDDEADTCELLATVLAHAHATVVTATTVEEGYRALVAQRPDVLISDIGMPDRDGYELIRRIRELGPEAGGRTPAIALTAFARSEDRTRAMLAGYQVHISKPIEPLELVATVRSLVAHRRDG
jgi:CheY-like chemotaxis protein